MRRPRARRDERRHPKFFGGRAKLGPFEPSLPRGEQMLFRLVDAIGPAGAFARHLHRPRRKQRPMRVMARACGRPVHPACSEVARDHQPIGRRIARGADHGMTWIEAILGQHPAGRDGAAAIRGPHTCPHGPGAHRDGELRLGLGDGCGLAMVRHAGLWHTRTRQRPDEHVRTRRAAARHVNAADLPRPAVQQPFIVGVLAGREHVRRHVDGPPEAQRHR